MLGVCSCSVPSKYSMSEGLWHVICDFSMAESVAGLYVQFCEAQAPWQGTTLEVLKLNRRTECVMGFKFSVPPLEVSGMCWGQTKWLVWGGTLLGDWFYTTKYVWPEIVTEGGDCPIFDCTLGVHHLPPHHFSFSIIHFSITSDYIRYRNTLFF